MEIKIDPHLFAILTSTASACELIEFLPETDLCFELKNLLNMQYDILSHYIEGKHFGTDQLEEFIQFSHAVLYQALELGNE